MLKIKDGQEIMHEGKVIEIEQDTITLDFNHPLAGKTLKFEVEIIDIY